MLPNHSPLVIAEQFGTLESLYPGRIDLGLGRAPGSDQITARALRRDLASDAREFPQDVQELADYFSDTPRQAVRAVPGAGLRVPLWILGRACSARSSPPHWAYPLRSRRISRPRKCCRPSQSTVPSFSPPRNSPSRMSCSATMCSRPIRSHEAQFRATSWQQAFINLRSGRPSQLPPPLEGYLERVGPHERALLDDVMSCSAIGSPEVVQAALLAFIARTGADELMIASQIFDHDARLRSYEIAAQAFKDGVSSS